MAKALQAWGRSSYQYVSPIIADKIKDRFKVRSRDGHACFAPSLEKQLELIREAIDVLGSCTREDCACVVDPSGDRILKRCTREDCAWVVNAIDLAGESYMSHAVMEVGAPRRADLSMELTHHLDQLIASRKSYEDLSTLSLGFLNLSGAFEVVGLSNTSDGQKSLEEHGALWHERDSRILSLPRCADRRDRESNQIASNRPRWSEFSDVAYRKI